MTAKRKPAPPSPEQVEVDFAMERMLDEWREREHRLDMALWQFLGDDLLVWFAIELIEQHMWPGVLARLSPELVEVLTAFADQRLNPSAAPRLH